MLLRDALGDCLMTGSADVATSKERRERQTSMKVSDKQSSASCAVNTRLRQ